MKRLILSLIILSLCVGCIPDAEDIYYRSVWRVKNATGQTLSFSPPPYGENTPYSIEPDGSIAFYSRGEYLYGPSWEDMMVCWRGREKEEILFEIWDIDGTLLKKWEFTGSDDYYGGYYNSGRHFFNPQTWVFSLNNHGRRKRSYEWIFEILPEDIQVEYEP